MKVVKQIFRLLYIHYLFIKHGLDEVILTTPLLKSIRFLLIFSPSHWTGNKTGRGERIRKTCEELGPIFVKFGQLLSTRIDLLPVDIASELVKLQDKVPPFPGTIAQEIIETALGKQVHELFKDFEVVPLASASIAQVHAATTLDGKQVVIKVLRPKIEEKIRQDIELLEVFAALLTKYYSRSRQFRPLDVIQEFKKSVFDELDLMREAANASQLRRNFHGSKLLYVPEIYWPYTKNNILVMERIYGVQVSNIEALKKNKVDLKLLAERGVEIFFTQVFRDCFFHADMHPGNVRVSMEDPRQPKYMALDFGIIGTLGPDDQRYLAENFLAFFKRDYRRVAQLHVESGWVPMNTRIDEFESAIRCVCEPIFERPLKDISFGKTLLRLFQTARRFNMEIQPQLILLQKTLISVEGLGRQLYPNLDLWNTAKPFLEGWMKQRMGSRALIRRIQENSPCWIEKLPELPKMIFNLMHRQPLKKIERSDNITRTSYGFVKGFVACIVVLIVIQLFSPNVVNVIQRYASISSLKSTL